MNMLKNGPTTTILSPAKNILKDIFIKSVESVKAPSLIKNKISVTKNQIQIGNNRFILTKKCFMVGFGKAVGSMAMEVANILKGHLDTGIIVVPKGFFDKEKQLKTMFSKIEFIEGAENNIPDQEALNGALKIYNLIQGLQESDLLIVLISGGGSALLPLPIYPITLVEKMDVIKNLSRAGATIQELNTVRKHLSVLKGGGLAKLAYPSKVVSLILSDVVGNPLDVIASGPTTPFTKDPDKAIQILQKYNLYTKTSRSIQKLLKNEAEILIDTKDPLHRSLISKKKLPDDGIFNNITNILIGTNRIATTIAKDLAVKMGYQSVILSHQVEGNVDKIAELYASLAKEISKGDITKIRNVVENLPFQLEDNVFEQLSHLDLSKKIFLILAGEPTVIVSGNGKGGRNQQLALAFALHFTITVNEKYRNITFLSGGTDGIDGPTDAAGAIVSSQLANTCFRLGINPDEYLKNNDSYGFFSTYTNSDCLLKIGHTGTNVMDLHFLVCEPEN